jgi:hypothetical protein
MSFLFFRNQHPVSGGEMNSCIVVADFGALYKYSFNTIPVQKSKYLCRICFKEYLDKLVEEFNLGPDGPTVLTIETPYFGGEISVGNPWILIEANDLTLREYYMTLIRTVFVAKYTYCGVEIFF